MYGLAEANPMAKIEKRSKTIKKSRIFFITNSVSTLFTIFAALKTFITCLTTTF